MPKDKLLTLFTKQLSRQQVDVMTKLWLVTALIDLVKSGVLTTDVISEPVGQLVNSENSLIIKEVFVFHVYS